MGNTLMYSWHREVRWRVTAPLDEGIRLGKTYHSRVFNLTELYAIFSPVGVTDYNSVRAGGLPFRGQSNRLTAH